MKLTPLEIKKQEFRRTLRGYDPLEVQTFLEMVAEQYEQLLEENKALQRRQIELETKLHDYQENEKTLRETLLNVQEVKKQSEESSRRQADLIIKEAELKALEILENARKQTRQIREELNWLKAQKESFINRLRHILVSQIELLSVMEMDDIVPEEMRESLRSSKPSRSGARRTAPMKEVPSTSGVEDFSEGADSAESERIILREKSTKETPEKPGSPGTDTPSSTEGGSTADSPGSSGSSSEPPLTEDDINEFFKKGIQIDELIKTLNKDESKK